MIPELGHFALLLALCLAVLQSVLPLAGAWRGQAVWMRTGTSLALGQLVFVVLAFLCLGYAFLTDDFSVAFVQGNSNTRLPDIYKFSAIWGGHEGSLLLWALMLSLWTAAVGMFGRHLPLALQARVLAVMGMVAVGFLSFTLFTSNPFDRILPQVPLEGRDLNPLLQDPGLIVHPPMLYMGYVGFSVAFAFAIAALIGGRLDTAWARWTRPWTNIAWAFLTLGIALGSWWAYYELGWGGWWFWDPVENASFMPWLVGTALIHSLAVTEKRGLFKSWTVLLAIFAFSLSLLGTFLVRSGVLTSVHSFASDPARGTYILIFLALAVGGSLTLYALRAPAVASSVSFSGWSREFLLLINNAILVVAAVTVLCGTLFPLAMDALGRGKYSVGPPYFNAVFVPLMCLLVVFMGMGPGARWKHMPAARMVGELWVCVVAALAIGVLFPYAYGGEIHWIPVLTALLAGWLVASTLRDLAGKLRNAPGLFQGMRRLSASYHGMLLAHLGFAVTLWGVGMTTHYSAERDLRMAPGDHVELAGYQFRFDGTRHEEGPNYVADFGVVTVLQAGSTVAVLHPEKRQYSASGQVMTEAGIDSGLTRDLYVALGDAMEQDAWSVRVHVKPFVNWIWWGAALMTLGGFLTAADRRYRVRRTAEAPVGAATAR